MEYYKNQKLNSIFDNEINKKFIIRRRFSEKDIIFSTEVTYLNQKGKPYMLYSEIIKYDGKVEICYRGIDVSGKISDRAYNDFEACYYDYSKPFEFILKL